MTAFKNPFWGRAFVFVLALAIGGVWAAPALAQTGGTGTMSIRVVDPDGVALPGAMVALQGPLGTNTQYTSIDGTTRVLGLYPGFYTATFSLDGFKTVVREELRITVSRTISVTVTLELASVEETITVTGESPVVDVKSTLVGSLYTDELIDRVPTASGMWAGVLDHVPSLVSDEVDIGGSESGQQSEFRAFGGVGESNQYNINGANATQVRFQGMSTAYYSISSFEEVGVSTASHDMATQGAGVQLNMVMKSGSNDWHAAVKGFYYQDSMVSNNVDQQLIDAGVSEGNPPVLLRDFDVQGGGPLVQNKVWFFADWWDFDVENVILGVQDDVNAISLRDYTLNVTWQINNDHKLSGRLLANEKFRNNWLTSRTTPPQSGAVQDQYTFIPQLHWQAVLGPNTFVDAIFQRDDYQFPFEAKDDDSPLPHPLFEPELPATLDLITRLWSGWPRIQFVTNTNRTQFNGSLSHYLTGENHSHDLRFGGDFSDMLHFAPQETALGVIQFTRRGRASSVRLYNTDPFATKGLRDIERPNAQTNNGKSLGLFAQDSWTIRNTLVINAGVRFDRSSTSLVRAIRPESNWPALGPDFQELEVPDTDITTFTSLVPRIGVIWDVNGDGRWALKANFSRYSEPQAVRWAERLNPLDPGYYSYFWRDRNGDGIFQFGEHFFNFSRFIPGGTETIDPNLSSPITNEVTVGAEHELIENFLVSANFIWRDRNNTIEEFNIGVPYGSIATSLGVPDSYAPVSVIDPGPDGVVGTADDGGPLTIYNQIANFGDDFFFITNGGDEFGFPMEWNYKGIELIAQKRWSDNWQMLASYTFGKAIIFEDLGDNPNRDINRNNVRSSYDRPHIFKLTTSYLFEEPIGVNLGLFWRLNSGQGRSRTFEFGSADGLAQGDASVRVAGRREDTIGEKAYPTLNIVDIRAEKQFTIGSYGVLHAYFDLFNLFNVNSVLSAENESGPVYNRINSIIPPRVFRIGGAWDF